MGHPHSSAAACRQPRGDDRGGCVQVGIDVVEDAVAVSVAELVDVEAREVAPPQTIVVLGEIAKEVELLEGCAEALRAWARRS